MGEQYCDYDMIVIGAGKVGLTAGFRSVELKSRVLVLEKKLVRLIVQRHIPK